MQNGPPDQRVLDERLEVAARCGSQLGEGPVWVAAEQALYWVDIAAPRIWRMVWPDGTTAHWTPPFRVSALAPARTGGFIAATDQGFARIDPAAGGYRLIGKPCQEPAGNRFNDGKVDPDGRFWTGSMDDAEAAETGALYRLGADGSWTTAGTGYRIPNGPAFAGRVMYLADSALRTIYRFALGGDGVPGTRDLFRRFGPSDGHPDGMTVDAEGCLWVAFWDGWAVRRFSAGGEDIDRLDLPVQRPTSCAFGGPALDRLYITSARKGLDAAALHAQPLAGALLMATPAIGGPALPCYAG